MHRRRRPTYGMGVTDFNAEAGPQMKRPRSVPTERTSVALCLQWTSMVEHPSQEGVTLFVDVMWNNPNLWPKVSMAGTFSLSEPTIAPPPPPPPSFAQQLSVSQGGGGRRTARGGTGHLGRTETQRGRLWTACGQRCVDSKNSQTTPATTSTSSIRQLLGAADAQTAHPATFSTAPAHQLLGSANAETTPAGAPAAAADRTQRPDATCEGKNG